MKGLLVLFVILTGSFSAKAQDILTLKAGKELLVKVVKVSPEKVIFRDFTNSESLVFSLPIIAIASIKYQNGTSHSFAPDPAPLSTTRNTHEVAINTLPFMFHSWNIFFDHRLDASPNTAISLGLGYFPDNDGSLNNSVDGSEIALTAAAKFYWGELDFYSSPYLRYRYTSQQIGATWHQLGVGGTIGWRHVFRSGFLLESFIGTGNYLLTWQGQVPHSEQAPAPFITHVRLGTCVGVAF